MISTQATLQMQKPIRGHQRLGRGLETGCEWLSFADRGMFWKQRQVGVAIPPPPPGELALGAQVCALRGRIVCMANSISVKLFGKKKKLAKEGIQMGRLGSIL